MTRRRRIRLTIGSAALALAAGLFLAPRAGVAQETVDARWLPWLGCWSEVGSSGEVVCVRPAGDAGGVELITLRDGEVAHTRRMRADGVVRETKRQGCTGTERADFSSDGHRLYLRTDFTCEGDLDRKGTGLVAWVTPTEWIRVETVEVGGETASVTERYRPAPEAAARDAGLEEAVAGRELAVTSVRQAAAAPPSVDELVAASERVGAEALRAWVAELEAPMEVDAGKLARLADAGVAPEVVDVVVAVSFSEHFAVDRDARGGDRGLAGPAGSPSFGRGYYDPFRFGRFGFFGFSRFGHGVGRFGFPFGHHGRPTVVVVRARGEGGDRGRVVNGRGYTRGAGSARDPAGAGRIESPSRGSVSPSGMSSGRPSGSTGRKAKPREDSSSDGGS